MPSRSRNGWKWQAPSASPSRDRCSCACSRSAARTSTRPQQTHSSPLRARAWSRSSARWRLRPEHGCSSPKAAHSRRTALLVELEQVVGTRSDPYYAFFLPELIRTAHALGQRELSARLVDGVEPVTPLFENALSACRAQSAEAAGEHAEAAALYAEAAERWVDVRERARARVCPARPRTLPHSSRRARCAGAAARGTPALRVDGLPARARGDRGPARPRRSRCRVETSASTICTSHAGGSGRSP